IALPSDQPTLPPPAASCAVLRRILQGGSMPRWIVPALGASTLLAAGLVIAPVGARAEKDDKPVIHREELVRFGGGRLGVRIADGGKDDVARLKLPDERGAL